MVFKCLIYYICVINALVIYVNKDTTSQAWFNVGFHLILSFTILPLHLEWRYKLQKKMLYHFDNPIVHDFRLLFINGNTLQFANLLSEYKLQ